MALHAMAIHAAFALEQRFAMRQIRFARAGIGDGGQGSQIRHDLVGLGRSNSPAAWAFR